MSDDNKHNLIYFEAASMRELYDTMEKWQESNQKRLLSTNIQKDDEKFCCIALTNPTEVIICSGNKMLNQAVIVKGSLWVSNGY